MSEVKHTPGPWVLVNGEHNRVKLINDGSGAAIGEYVDCRSPANAALIAAAPDLLASLQEFIACGPNAGHNAELIGQCKATIAKATGV